MQKELEEQEMQEQLQEQEDAKRAQDEEDEGLSELDLELLNSGMPERRILAEMTDELEEVQEEDELEEE